VDQRVKVASTLPCGGVQRVGICRIDDYISSTGILCTRDDRLPRAAAIGRFIKPSLAATRPQRALSSDKYNVTVTRVDNDPADVLGGLKTHIAPGPAAVV